MSNGQAMIKTKIKFITIIQYLFVFATILQCNTIFYRQSGANHEKQLLVVWFLLVIILWGIANLNFIKQKYDLRKLISFELIWTTLVVTFMTISYIRNPFSITTIIIIGIPFFVIPIFLDDFNGTGKLLIRFRNIVLVLAVISLLFWALSMLGLSTNSSTVINWGRVESINGYFNIHYIAQGSINFLGLHGIVRNTGIFVEAPMYSYVLCMALIVDIFLDTDLQGYSKKSMLLMVTIFTTTSSTGIILVLLIIFSKMIFLSNRISKGLKAIIIIGLLPVLSIIILYIIKSKLDSNWYSSTSVRINDFVAGYQALKNHLFFGNGMNNYNSILQNMDARRLILGANSGFSSGLMEVLAYGGIAYMLYFLTPIILLFKSNKINFLVASISFVLFTFTLVNNVFLWYVFISYFWAVWLSNNRKRKLEI